MSSTPKKTDEDGPKAGPWDQETAQKFERSVIALLIMRLDGEL